MTIESLVEIANSTPKSKNTEPGEILFFRSNSTAGESLKKLQNHNFTIGYAFTIGLNNGEFTRIVAYNHKNDIFRGWMGSIVHDNGSIDTIFPLSVSKFPCSLNMPRINSDGKLKLYRESFNENTRKSGFSKKQFCDLQNIENIDDPSLYGQFWPILEHPEVELNKRKKMASNQDKYSVFYSDIASI